MNTMNNPFGLTSERGTTIRPRFGTGWKIKLMKAQGRKACSDGLGCRPALRSGRVWMALLVMLAGVWLTPLDAAAWRSIKKEGGAGKTAEIKVEKVTAMNLNTKKSSVAQGDWVTIECSYSVSPPEGHPTYVGGGSWKNELRVDGNLVHTCHASLEYNSILAAPIVRKCGGYSFMAKGVGEHTATCIVNADNKLPEVAACKDNNSASVQFSVVKVLKQPTKWPGY